MPSHQLLIFSVCAAFLNLVVIIPVYSVISTTFFLRCFKGFFIKFDKGGEILLKKKM